nr:MAG TPA: hypothetical protein [Caudoviricetes sp.]
MHQYLPPLQLQPKGTPGTGQGRPCTRPCS